MNLLIDPLFIFIFLFTLFYFGIPNIDDDNFVKHKLFIFIAIFCFNFALQLIKRLRSKCLVRTNEILRESLITALMAVIGYSVCTDLVNMSSTKEWVEGYGDNYNKKSLLITLIIVAFVSFSKIMAVVIKPDEECLPEVLEEERSIR